MAAHVSFKMCPGIDYLKASGGMRSRQKILSKLLSVSTPKGCWKNKNGFMHVKRLEECLT